MSVSISKATREILGKNPDLLKDLERGKVKQRRIAKKIMSEIKKMTGQTDITEASVAVAISRYLRELKGSSAAEMQNYIETCYYIRYLQSATLRTIDNIAKIYFDFRILKSEKARSKLIEQLYPEFIHNPSIPIVITYPSGIELYITEVAREKFVKQLNSLMKEESKGIIQRKGFALVTIQMNTFSESTPGFLSYLVGMISRENIKVADLTVKHGELLEINIITVVEDSQKLEQLIRLIRESEEG